MPGSLHCVTQRVQCSPIRPAPLVSERTKGGFSFMADVGSKYSKSHLTFDKQLKLLESRGLVVGDRERALRTLAVAGYYNLGSYLYPFRIHEDDQRSDTFMSGAKFEDAVALYDFDRALRHLCLEGLEVVERAVKVSIAYRLGLRDTFAHATGSLHQSNSLVPEEGTTKSGDFDAWQKKHERQIKRNGVSHISRFADRYGTPFPIWVAVELMDFGDVSKLLGMVVRRHQNEVAHDFDVFDGRVFASWVRTLCHVRNISAHHDRLWNRELIDVPLQPGPRDSKVLDGVLGQQRLWSRTYTALLICGHLLVSIDPGTQWPTKLRTLLESAPDSPGGTHANLGAPDSWREHRIWAGY